MREILCRTSPNLAFRADRAAPFMSKLAKLGFSTSCRACRSQAAAQDAGRTGSLRPRARRVACMGPSEHAPSPEPRGPSSPALRSGARRAKRSSSPAGPGFSIGLAPRWSRPRAVRRLRIRLALRRFRSEPSLRLRGRARQRQLPVPAPSTTAQRRPGAPFAPSAPAVWRRFGAGVESPRRGGSLAL